MRMKYCNGKVPWGKTCKSLGLTLPAITLTAVFGMALDGHFQKQLDERLRTAVTQIAQNQQDICGVTTKDRQLTQSVVSRSIGSRQPEAAPFYTAYARLAPGLSGYADKRENFVTKVEQLAQQGIGVCFSTELTPGAVADSKTIYLDPDAKYKFADTVFLNGLKAFETGRFDSNAGKAKQPPAGKPVVSKSGQGISVYSQPPAYYYRPVYPGWR